MAKNISDKTLLLRDALGRVLARAEAPLNAREANTYREIIELGTPPSETSMELAHMWAMKTPPFPIARINGANGFEYFNPDVVKLAYAPLPKVKKVKPAPPVNSVKSPANPVLPADFVFNPVEFDPATPPAPGPVPATEPAPVTLPPGVKSIILTIGGVQIKIEMQP